jgi:hypothetical protein
MEHKIGEIFELGSEWYQCVKGDCTKCDFFIKRGCVSPLNTVCGKRIRKDKQNVIFKKLEKVGEPFTSVGKLYQHYKVFDIDNVYGDIFLCVHNYKAKTLTIEIKQNKEEMKENHSTENYPNTEEIAIRIADNVMEDVKNQLERNMNKLRLKPFDLQKAKQGKPVCTRDGRKARIICFDAKGEKPIIALIANGNSEDVNYYYITGKVRFLDKEDENDLMMLPEKKEGWVNVYKKEQNRYVKGIFPSREIALNFISEKSREYIATIKITWEE